MSFNGKPGTRPQQLADRDRAVRALDLRRDGWQWRDIADELDYFDAGTAYKAATRLLARVESETAAEYRTLLTERYEALWSDARTSLAAAAPDAANRGALLSSARGVLDSLAKLHGLSSPDLVAPMSTPTRVRDEIDNEIAHLVGLIKSRAPDAETPVLDGIVAEVAAMSDGDTADDLDETAGK